MLQILAEADRRDHERISAEHTFNDFIGVEEESQCECTCPKQDLMPSIIKNSEI